MDYVDLLADVLGVEVVKNARVVDAAMGSLHTGIWGWFL